MLNFIKNSRRIEYFLFSLSFFFLFSLFIPLKQWLTDLEIFATLVAAIIHDYQHTGTTNNFHIMSGYVFLLLFDTTIYLLIIIDFFSVNFFIFIFDRSEISLLYNDRSVLENFHISEAFRVIRKDDANIVANLSREEYRYIY